MARANVLQTSQARRAAVLVPMQRSPVGSIVTHGYRIRAGIGKRITLDWTVAHEADFNAYLMQHYRANRRVEFDVDLVDGKGYLGCRYVSPPQLTASGRSGAGTYSVTIEYRDVRESA